MPNIYESMVIDAPVDAVWARVRDFGAIHQWVAEAAGCALDDGETAPRTGCVRRIDFPGGAFVRERLEALSDVERSLSYSMAESNIPPAMAMRGYVGTIRLFEITDDGRTFVAWSARFDVESGADAKAIAEGITGSYKSMLGGLKKSFL